MDRHHRFGGYYRIFRGACVGVLNQINIMKSIIGFYRYITAKKPLREVYAHATRWQVLKYAFVWIFMRRALHVAMFVGFSVGVYNAGRYFNPVTVYADKHIDDSEAMLEAKIDGLREGVVDTLMKCEGAAYKEADGLVTYDPRQSMYGEGSSAKNWKQLPSFGLLQWKIPTVQYYVKLRTGEVITPKQAIELALDTARARDLAKWVMFNTKGMASGDWKNCAASGDLDRRIVLIKSLVK